MIDLRSDTVTLPSPAMREAIARAEVGDDVYREDPTVIELEEESARLLGMEAGLLIPSGTMGNLAAVLTHCGRGSEALMGDKAHTFMYEVGGMAALGGVHPRTLPNQPDGTISLDDIRGGIRTDDIHDPPTRLIILENTHNRCGGAAVGPEYISAVAAIAREHGLKLHLDGARLFNASAALDLEPARLVEEVDSVMFCLSKGLGAPVGSLLCGREEFIHRARKTRKMLGGGMRQAGIIAAAGLYALRNNLPLLGDDHLRAGALARNLADLQGASLKHNLPPTNMVYLNLDPGGSFTAPEIARQLREKGILVGVESEYQFRMVVHLWIQDEDIDEVAAAFRKILGSDPQS